ncbi:MAG: TrkH family potassium uptake protein [Thermoleophilia bacterium]
MPRGGGALPARARVFRHPARLVVGGFAGAVLLGTLMLMLSAATPGAGEASFRAAFFTAMSAVTVTGMSTVDVSTYWSPFGQAIILVLIQIGALGIVTSASLLLIVVSRKMGLRSRLATQIETPSADLGGVRRLVAAILTFTLAIEAAVATILTLRLWLAHDRSFPTALWEGTFHAVSAFGDAGFSLYRDSLTQFATDGWILVPVACAVIVGGLGFPVWLEVRRRPRSPSRWSLHTKLTLVTTGVLLAFGIIALTALEWNDADTLGRYGVGGKLLSGFFAGVMPRTAGFNTIDYAHAGTDSQLVTDMLMFAGGGSASTAGGIKVTTFAILFLIVWAELRGEKEVAAFGRAIPSVVLRQAFTIAVISINAIVLGTLALIATNDLDLSEALFECVAAFSTAGLSTGLTHQLDAVGEAILMALMFVGRVGPLTIGIALVLRERERLYSHPEERPLVG